jgi:hypothetical protein
MSVYFVGMKRNRHNQMVWFYQGGEALVKSGQTGGIAGAKADQATRYNAAGIVWRFWFA